VIRTTVGAAGFLTPPGIVQRMRTALTVAGSDSGGGAGIQADLKSFAAVGVHGCSVVTCVTAQNTRAVTSIFPLPVREIRAQLEAILSDIPIHAAKTGMLYSRDIVKTVAEGLPKRAPLVVDPVMRSSIGSSRGRPSSRPTSPRPRNSRGSPSRIPRTCAAPRRRSPRSDPGRCS